MAYVRKGMGIRDLAYLGRWKSSVVLTSAEEALETTPANRGVQFQEETSVAAPKTPSRILVEAVVKKAAEPGPSLAAGAHLGNRTKAASLWVKSTERRSGNPLHYVTIADWSLAMSSWSTRLDVRKEISTDCICDQPGHEPPEVQGMPGDEESARQCQ